MENKLFACEMFGCFDSSTQDVTFANDTYQLCDSCASFADWQKGQQWNGK